jgi:hypothetical protein
LYGSVVLAVAATAALLAGAQPPAMTDRVAHGSGRGSVTVAVTTGRLRHGVWLRQVAGSGAAKAQVTCRRRLAHGGTGTTTWFRFPSRAGAWHEVWRYAGQSCDVEVTVTGRGALAVELRGR